jgi:hypothetical protein
MSFPNCAPEASDSCAPAQLCGSSHLRQTKRDRLRAE